MNSWPDSEAIAIGPGTKLVCEFVKDKEDKIRQEQAKKKTRECKSYRLKRFNEEWRKNVAKID